MDLAGMGAQFRPLFTLKCTEAELARVAIQVVDNQLRAKLRDLWGPLGVQKSRLRIQETGLPGSPPVASGASCIPLASVASSYSPISEN